MIYYFGTDFGGFGRVYNGLDGTRMRKLKRSYSRGAWMLLALLLCLMVAGSLFDFEISSALYPGKESSFGQFFAAFGELPAFLALICAGALLFAHRSCLRRDWNVLYLLGSGGLVFGGIFLSVHEATDNVPALPAGVALLVTVFFGALCAMALLALSSGAQGKTIIRFVLTLVFVCVGTMVAINLVKVPWGRARMRLIVSTGNASYFTPWWKAGSALKNQLVASGVSSDEFRSFPSGHTACAACAMLLALLPTLCKRLRGKERRLGLLGVLWTAVVAVSRLMMGAHFLTDVTMAWLITLGLTALGVYLFYFNKKFFAFVWSIISEREEVQYEE